MNGRKIVEILENKFPLCNAEDWDNVGLIVGNVNRDIKKIQLSLDVTKDSLENAIKEKVDMIISHHPMIFDPVKYIRDNDILGNKIIKLIEKHICLYTLHTNLDSSKNGLNEYILDLLDVKDFEILDINNEENESGIGRYFILDDKISILEYINILKEKLKLINLRCFSRDINRKIDKIAIINGAGGNYWRKAKELDIDLFITGDVKYHDGLDSSESGVDIIDIGHYESEKFFANVIQKYLETTNLDIITYDGGNLFTIL
ncbi:MAG: Nif3-like dinuclear metal center hexameric protein [Fusobacteriaceae bacterium]|jgi:dinuclear metal center YbgI/SA1388 family protein|nr:Nif3-like dinuclear metal center hexameric protein [Fusobacteriaceae bacterium]